MKFVEDNDLISSGTNTDENISKHVQNNVKDNSSGGVIPTSNNGAVMTITVPEAVQKESTMSLRSGCVIGSQIDKDLYEQHGSKQADEMQKLIKLERQINVNILESVNLALVSSLYSTMKEQKTFMEAMNSSNSDKW